MIVIRLLLFSFFSQFFFLFESLSTFLFLKMFGGLPTPTETEAPDNVLTAGSASTTASVDYHHHHHHDHPDCDGSPGSHEDHNGHLTTSQSAHITLRFEQQK
jgi:hypothetical protein